MLIYHKFTVPKLVIYNSFLNYRNSVKHMMGISCVVYSLHVRKEVSEESLFCDPSQSTGSGQTQNGQPPKHMVWHVGLPGPHTQLGGNKGD